MHTQSKHEYSYRDAAMVVSIGIFIFLICAGFALLTEATKDTSPEYAQYQLVKTALENDELWAAGSCRFGANATGHSTGFECDIREFKIGKARD